MIKVLFFGSIATELGKHTCSLPLTKGMVIQEVIEAVGCDHFTPLLVAVNQQHVLDMSVLVHDEDEVALMPPFSGG